MCVFVFSRSQWKMKFFFELYIVKEVWKPLIKMLPLNGVRSHLKQTLGNFNISKVIAKKKNKLNFAYVLFSGEKLKSFHFSLNLS